MKKNIPLFKVFMADTVSQALEPVLNSGYVGQGPKVEEFETLLKDYFGTDYLLTVNSCTSALQLANYLIKPPEGWSCNDEILVSPLTCFATVSAIMAHGCKVRWVDTDPNTCNIDLLDAERKLTENTRAISFVHWGGTPVDLYRINILKEMYYSQYGRELYIIEDCAHCWNTKIDNRLIGIWGNFACFSLQAIKFLNTADGGFIILPDRETYERAKLLRWFGLDRDKGASFRCLHPQTHIRLADGTTKCVVDVVKEKDIGPVMVKSGNKLVPRRITGWHTNDLKGRKVLKISTKNLSPSFKTYVTEDHLIFTKDNGWVQAKDLENGTLIATSFPNATKIQRSVILGSLLGDGGLGKITKNKYRSVFQERHSPRQKEYLELKHKSLLSLGSTLKFSEPNNNQNRPNGSWYISTRSLPVFGEYAKYFYPEHKKIVPRDLIEKEFTELALAIWFMDDGNVIVHNQIEGLVPHAKLATNGFVKEDVEWLVEFLCNKGYECRIAHGGGYRINFTVPGSKKLLSDIAKYVPPSMRYKVAHSNDLDKFDESLWIDEFADVYYDEAIIEEHKNYHKTVYCLSVEGEDANFSTSAIIVHNCIQDITEAGFKYQMNDIAATIGVENFGHMKDTVAIHKDNAQFYNEHLKSVSGVTLLEQHEGFESSYWLYTMKVQDRDGFTRKMKENGIDVNPVHARCDKHSCVSQYMSFLPGMDYLEQFHVSIPVGWWVTKEDREYIVDTIKKGW